MIWAGIGLFDLDEIGSAAKGCMEIWRTPASTTTNRHPSYNRLRLPRHTCLPPKGGAGRMLGGNEGISKNGGALKLRCNLV